MKNPETLPPVALRLSGGFCCGAMLRNTKKFYDLFLLLCGVCLIRQKYDPEKIAADKKKVEDMEKEKAELEKKLASME